MHISTITDMNKFYCIKRSKSQIIEDWLIVNGTGYNWYVQQVFVSDIVDTTDIPNNRANIYIIIDDQFAMMFKMMFADLVFNSPEAFGDYINQKRLTL
jgi:hypothetical protein